MPTPVNLAPAMKVVTAAQMVALEQAAMSRGVTSDAMMETAGLAVARAAQRRLNGVAGAKVAVLVGPGNNGGDGLVAARHLRRWGAEVTACMLTPRPAEDPKLELARLYGVSLVFPTLDSTAELETALAGCRLAIDAVLGTGRARPLEGLLEQASGLVQARRAAGRMTVLALDMPTGLDADTGEIDPACYAADVTVTLGFPKVGLLTLPGAGLAGDLEVAGIGTPPGMEQELAESLGLDLELLTPEWVARQLPPRPVDSHKGTFGHALVVAGSRNYAGAASLASQAAVRAGAGLVTMASPKGVYPIAAARAAEPIHLPLPEDDEGRIHPVAAGLISGSPARYSSILVGCGLGWSPGVGRFVEELLLGGIPGDAPVIVDADGLNNLSRLDEWWRRLESPAVVTPHPGEMATLTGQPIPDRQCDRLSQVREWSSRWGVVVVLKGAYTLIAEPGGTVWVSPFANAGLSTGGTGDVLSGVIAGLMAQGLEPAVAAACGVYLHGSAGEAAAAARGDAGMNASDLLELLPQAISRVKDGAVA